MDCKKCHRAIPDDARYCQWCGYDNKPKEKTKARRANGTGSIVKCKDRRAKPYRAVLMENGIRHNVGYFKTVAEANKAIATYDETVRPPSVITLKRAYERMMEHKRATMKESSIEAYNSFFKRMSAIADRNTCDLRAADFQQIIDTMRLSGFQRTTCAKVKQMTSHIWQWLIANQIATEDTISPYLELPPQEKKSKECETFSREDIDRLWTDDTDEARITLVMIYTGMRIGEILAVRKSDVHLDDNGHNYLIGGEKTEAGRNRTIALHPRIVPFFEAWIAVRDDDDLLVTNAHGNPLSPTLFRERWYAPLLKRVGIPYISPHKARHTFATLVCAAGGNEVALQRQLGHSDFSTTANTYIHPDISALEAIVKLIE